MGKSSLDYIAQLWPNSAEIREKYLSYRLKHKHIPQKQDTMAADSQRIKHLEALLKQQLCSFFSSSADDADDAVLEDTYTESLHLLYKELQRDWSHIFLLLEDNVLLLLSRLPFGKFPRDAAMDHISIFNILLTEITKRFDDCSSEFDQVLAKACRVFGFLLINGLRFNMLSMENVDLFLTFAINLVKYLITMTPVVDYWFDTVVKEPDTQLLLLKYKLKGDVFPLYELAKEFMFLDERLSLKSQTILSHIVLITGFSEPLRDWLLRSDFPRLIVTGFHSSFNQFCYQSEVLPESRSETDIVDLRVQRQVKFMQDLISFASHDIIKVVLINNLKVNFIDKALASYVEAKLKNESALRNMMNIIIALITPSSSECAPVIEFIADELSEEYLQECKLLEIVICCMKPDNWDFTTETKCTALEFLTSFYEAGSDDTKKRLFCIDSLDVCLNDKAVFLASGIPSMTQSISDSNDFYQSMLTKTLHRDFRSISSSVSIKPKHLLFDPTKPLSVSLLVNFINFFQNDDKFNRFLTKLLCDLNNVKYGNVKNAFFTSTDGQTTEVMGMSLSLNYNWDCYNEYSALMVTNTTGFINKRQPSSSQLNVFRAVDNNISSTLSKSRHVNLESLELNLELFREFIVNLYGLYIAKKLFAPLKKS